MGAVIAESFAEPLYCDYHGAFSRANLDVDLTTFTAASALQQAVVGNSLDVGIVDVIQLTNAVNHGLDYCFFAGSLLYTSKAPTTLLSVAKNGPIRSAKDLVGKTIGVVTLNSVAEFATREWMSRNGSDPSSVKFVEIRGPSMAPAIMRGTVAAAMIFEPFLSAASADCVKLGDPYSTIASQFLLNAWYARRDWLKTNAAIIPPLRQAIYETAAWVNRNHSESAPVLQKYIKMSAEQVAEMTRATFATNLDARLIDPVIDFALKYKAIGKRISAADLSL